MPFEFGSSFNKFTRYACGEGGIIYSLTSNPIYLSLLLTALLMITVIALIGEDTEEVLGKKDFVRLGIYFLIVTCVVVSMHHYTYLHAMKNYESQNGLQRVFNTISDVSNNPNLVSYPVLGSGEKVEREIPTPEPQPLAPGEIEDVNLDL
jgi:hypothetical protein